MELPHCTTAVGSVYVEVNGNALCGVLQCSDLDERAAYELHVSRGHRLGHVVLWVPKELSEIFSFETSR